MWSSASRHRRLQILLLLRKKKYDGTRTKASLQRKLPPLPGVANPEQFGSDGTVSTSGPAEIQVTEAIMTVLLRKIIEGRNISYLTVRSELPCEVLGINRTTGECIRETWKTMNLPFDAELDAEAFRAIDLAIRDDATSNDRAERSYRIDNPKRKGLTFI